MLNMMCNIKKEISEIHFKMNQIGGFRNCVYIYLDLTYFNSLKQKLDFDSEELFGLQGGNLVDYLSFLMSIIYVGSGTDCRKISHSSSADATKYKRKLNPQKVHKDLLKKWSADTEVGITQFCSNSSKDESGLFESFLILFLKYYKYNIATLTMDQCAINGGINQN